MIAAHQHMQTRMNADYTHTNTHSCILHTCMMAFMQPDCCASSLGAFEGHAKIKDYIILNELGEAKDISASQDLKKPAGVIQFKAQETFVDFKKFSHFYVYSVHQSTYLALGRA